ncbi:tripartite tricarboxylate transporter substrate binding protein [Pollutimonas bauzanensis]|uniref:Bug family tripartite tricarboxylate transporter substrate binding protein n=1 Tax=Pollutimonas bauzanensis TaxID=658167 RepID=UPI00333E3711
MGKMVAVVLAGFVYAVTGITAASAADAYPSKPIRIVVGFPAGQATDIIARLVAKKLQESLKQSIIVENKPGAGGIIGTMEVIRATPDGYTLLVSSSGPLAINPSLYAKIPYDVMRDLQPISEVAEVPLFLAVGPKLPVKTAKEFVEKVHATPGKLDYASAGNGVTSHLAMELLKHELNLDLQHIPYKGSPAAVVDLIGGQTSVMVDTGPALLPSAENGKLRILAVLSDKRVAAAPDVPTGKEAGIGELNAPAWVGLVAPKGTPDEIIQTLYKALDSNWRDEDVKQALNGLGSQVVLSTPAEFTTYIQQEIKKWHIAVELSGAKVD